MTPTLKAGDRVRVVVSTEKRDPWLTPKQGWEGVAVAPALNMEATHWQIRFVEPWCSLGITRIMPLDSIQVVMPRQQETGNPIDQGIPDTHSVGPVDDQIQEASVPTDKFDSDVDSKAEDDHQAPIDDAISDDYATDGVVVCTDKNPELTIGSIVRVRPKAGAGTGEEHVMRRRNQEGRISRLCEIATSCVEVTFCDQSLPVIIPRAALQLAGSGDETLQRTAKSRLAIKKQMTLPL